MNKNVFRNFSYGVYLVSSLDNQRPTGCIANSAMQITSAPATIAVSINHDNFTNECIRKSGRFAVSILSENTPSDLIGQFGFHSGKDINKFDSVPIPNGIRTSDTRRLLRICHLQSNRYNGNSYSHCFSR